jgi:hypothetical protein
MAQRVAFEYHLGCGKPVISVLNEQDQFSDFEHQVMRTMGCQILNNETCKIQDAIESLMTNHFQPDPNLIYDFDHNVEDVVHYLGGALVPTLPTVFVLTFLSQASQAYIDPSAGSLLWPFLISVLATAVHWLYNFRNKKHVDLRRVRGKRQVLQQLESLNLKSQVLPLLWISRVNWQQDKQKFARQVATLNSTQDLIVRSSAQGEDSELQTHAGAFDSQVLLKGSEQAKACNTIDKVFEGMHGHLHDEIFVQEYLSNVQSCGVVFSRHFHFWNYLVHSQANAPHSTAAITAGDLTDSATTVHYRPQLSELNSQSEAITDTLRIEREFGFEIADIEYAQQGHRSILFQARGLVPEDKPSYYGPLLDSHKMQQFNHNANLTLEKYGPLSCMSDWNPAEILGLVPGEFAASLFEDLIGKETWIAARESLGYQSVSDRTLTARLAGDVYIKTQLSALSLIPATVDQNWLHKRSMISHRGSVNLHTSMIALSFNYGVARSAFSEVSWDLLTKL